MAEEREQQKHEFASSYHAPVMYKECIDALLKRSHLHIKKSKNKYKNKKKGSEGDVDDGNTNTVGEEKEKQDHNVRRTRVFIDGE